MCLSNSEAQEHKHMSVSLQNVVTTYYKLMILVCKTGELWDHISPNILALSLRQIKTEKVP
jgi:hypothetical protein